MNIFNANPSIPSPKSLTGLDFRVIQRLIICSVPTTNSFIIHFLDVHPPDPVILESWQVCKFQRLRDLSASSMELLVRKEIPERIVAGWLDMPFMYGHVILHLLGFIIDRDIPKAPNKHWFISQLKIEFLVLLFYVIISQIHFKIISDQLIYWWQIIYMHTWWKRKFYECNEC